MRPRIRDSRLPTLFAVAPLYLVVAMLTASTACSGGTTDAKIIPPDSTGTTVAPTGPGPHEPPGFVPQYDDSLSAMFPDSPQMDRYGFFGYKDEHSNVELVQDDKAAATPPYLYRLVFPANSDLGGTAPLRFQAGSNFAANTGNLYVRMRFRISSNYTNNQNVGTKFWFPRPGDAASGEGSINHFFAFTDANTTTAPHNKTELFFGTQFAGGGAGTAAFYSGYDVPKGVWHDMEYLLIANTPGQPDGKVFVWIDGTLRLSVDNAVLFQSGMTPHWGYIWVDPTYGFGSGPTPGFDMSWDIDQWYASVR